MRRFNKARLLTQKMRNKRGQIWIETVLYTLIGLALIGLVLAFISPRINDEKDRIVVEQTLASLNVFDERIGNVLEGGTDNRRVVEFGMRRGELYFNSSTDKILFVLKDLRIPYTEPNVPINFGRIEVVSVEGGKTSSVFMTLDYKILANLTFAGEDIDKKFSASSTPYRFSVENKGRKNSLFDVININVL